PSAPLLTAWLIALQARATTSISRRSSGCRSWAERCCSTRYWVSVLRFKEALLCLCGEFQCFRDDFPHVARQAFMVCHVLQRPVHGVAQRRHEARPVVQRARQAGGDLGVEPVQRNDLLGPV